MTIIEGQPGKDAAYRNRPMGSDATGAIAVIADLDIRPRPDQKGGNIAACGGANADQWPYSAIIIRRCTSGPVALTPAGDAADLHIDAWQIQGGPIGSNIKPNLTIEDTLAHDCGDGLPPFLIQKQWGNIILRRVRIERVGHPIIVADKSDSILIEDCTGNILIGGKPGSHPKVVVHCDPLKCRVANDPNNNPGANIAYEPVADPCADLRRELTATKAALEESQAYAKVLESKLAEANSGRDAAALQLQAWIEWGKGMPK